jgi:hypothetical protein
MAFAGFAQTVARPEVWHFDNLSQIGGHKVTMTGRPKVIDTPHGKAVEFNGQDDGLFFDAHPLAGAAKFTWEVIFRPDSGGKPEQRFFHLQSQDPMTKAEMPTRMLFEIRVEGDKWALDSYVLSGPGGLVLLDRTKLHPLDQWYRIAMVYDGAELRDYVNGELQGSGAVKLIPEGPGHASAGVRLNKRDYFKGAILLSRTTPHVLPVSDFVKLP